MTPILGRAEESIVQRDSRALAHVLDFGARHLRPKLGLDIGLRFRDRFRHVRLHHNQVISERRFHRLGDLIDLGC